MLHHRVMPTAHTSSALTDRSVARLWTITLVVENSGAPPRSSMRDAMGLVQWRGWFSPQSKRNTFQSPRLAVTILAHSPSAVPQGAGTARGVPVCTAECYCIAIIKAIYRTVYDIV